MLHRKPRIGTPVCKVMNDHKRFFALSIPIHLRRFGPKHESQVHWQFVLEFSIYNICHDFRSLILAPHGLHPIAMKFYLNISKVCIAAVTILCCLLGANAQGTIFSGTGFGTVDAGGSAYGNTPNEARRRR